MPADKPGRGSDQFPLRLPDGMRERIKAAADASGRSMNAEIIHRLETTFIDGYQDQVRDEVSRLERRLLQLQNEAIEIEAGQGGLRSIEERLKALESRLGPPLPKE